MTYDFSQIEEIHLSRGAHKSPEEGVCFYEAVAFFAGEPHSDHPECACPVLTAYGINLNDRMPDDVRNRLLRPLIPLVAGTRDSASEQKRAEFLAMWATNKILPIVLRAHGFEDHAKACETATNLGEAEDAAANAAAYANSTAANAAANAAYAAVNANAAAAYTASSSSANVAANAAYAAANATDIAAKATDEIWTVAAQGLRQAILIGRHEGFAIAEEVLAERHEKLRELVGTHQGGTGQ